jgi:hypothetical protein
MQRILSIGYRARDTLHFVRATKLKEEAPHPRCESVPPLRARVAMPPVTAPPLAPRRELCAVSPRTPSEPSRPEPPPTAIVSPCRRPPPTVWMVRRLESIGRERETKWMVRAEATGRDKEEEKKRKKKRKEKKRKKKKKEKKRK